MRFVIRAVILGLSLNLLSLSAGAVEAPIRVTHEATEFTKQGNYLTVDYTLSVVNHTEGTLSQLVLVVAPPRQYPKARTTLDVGTLAPNQTTSLSFQLRVPASVGKEMLSREPLFIGAKGIDADGNVIEFSATSYPGGAK